MQKVTKDTLKGRNPVRAAQRSGLTLRISPLKNPHDGGHPIRKAYITLPAREVFDWCPPRLRVLSAAGSIFCAWVAGRMAGYASFTNASSAQAPYRSPRPSAKARSFRCASSPHRTRFAGLRRGPLFSVAPKRENPPEGLLAASRLTLAGRARSTAQPLAALPLRAAASPSRGKEKKTFWSLWECTPFIGAAEEI